MKRIILIPIVLGIGACVGNVDDVGSSKASLGEGLKKPAVFENCHEFLAIVPADPAQLSAHLPEGFQLAAPGWGINAHACGRQGNREVRQIHQGIPVIPPPEWRHKDPDALYFLLAAAYTSHSAEARLFRDWCFGSITEKTTVDFEVVNHPDGSEQGFAFASAPSLGSLEVNSTVKMPARPVDEVKNARLFVNDGGDVASIDVEFGPHDLRQAFGGAATVSFDGGPAIPAVRNDHTFAGAAGSNDWVFKNPSCLAPPANDDSAD